MDSIDKYEILDKIGSGGFAIVYKGYDPHIKRLLAIKVCYSQDEETRGRFHREAEVAGQLEHRNITQVHAFGFHEQMPYLVEEYLTGEDLAHLIRRGEPDTIHEKIDILLQVAGGLDYAHSRGVIHRDIKPANIRLLDDGRVKIMDFGTAKFADIDSQLTQTGMTLGTVAYLSPERLLGEDRGSAASDIFSFGVLAYELLSNERPFPGKSIPQLIDQVLNGEPVPLLESFPECPRRLAEIVHQCLAAKSQGRYVSCGEIIRELEELRLTISGVEPSGLAAQDSSASGMVSRKTLQAVSLLERAKENLAKGKPARAEILLEEVLEIDPGNREARRLLDEAEEGGLGGPATPAATPQDADRERSENIRSAIKTIEQYTAARQLGQAVEALRFASRMFGELERGAALRRQIIETLRGDILTLKGRGLRQGGRIVEQARRLADDGRLDSENARTFADWVDDLDVSRQEEMAEILSRLDTSPPPPPPPPSPPPPSADS